ncbi:MAG: NADH-quinone oxidoreductase subunit C [Candidatus Omnitrophota bacterium]|nr:NADH-quinone oxidoreductase subunit C [Candidatus Omnitrophota bacterium]MBU1895025.1 NADH-quinone oxidoreductase subunit C [Candidatus Omnitrophota bacterium]
MAVRFLKLHNCQAKRVDDLPQLSFEEFRDFVVKETRSGARVVSFFASPGENGAVKLMMILAYNKEGYLKAFYTVVKDSYVSLTNSVPQVHWFEREIFEQVGVCPNGHPWLKPIRFSVPHKNSPNNLRFKEILPSVTNFLKVQGEEIHEVAVGPVHAGIIESGHFRFQCHGEQVFHLEISLGYQHRGIEKALAGGPDKKTIHYMETASGDTTVGHSLAYCQAIEALSDCDVPLRASALRSIMLELERLANHTGDLGALASDVGYLPTSAYCGRLRGDFLNITAFICGNRFGHNMVRPGGVMFDLDNVMISELKKRLEKTFIDVKNAVSLMWDSSLVLDRFEETGVVSVQAALELGLVGVAARACGLEQDVRFDFPVGAFRFSQIPLSTCSSGDVFARAFVRWLEIQRSFEFIMDQLNNLPESEIAVSTEPIKSEKMVISLVEAWRGEICHVVFTDKKGNISQYKMVDPSFHNWIGLAMALRGEEISDFPLCNKSFNLSYCGHDL